MMQVLRRSAWQVSRPAAARSCRSPATTLAEGPEAYRASASAPGRRAADATIALVARSPQLRSRQQQGLRWRSFQAWGFDFSLRGFFQICTRIYKLCSANCPFVRNKYREESEAIFGCRKSIAVSPPGLPFQAKRPALL